MDLIDEAVARVNSFRAYLSFDCNMFKTMVSSNTSPSCDMRQLALGLGRVYTQRAMADLRNRDETQPTSDKVD